MRTATDMVTPDLFGFSPSISPDNSPAARRYPDAAGFKGERGGPSEQAAKVIALSVTGRRREVLEFLRHRAAEPMTADQIATALNRSPFGIRPRVTELHRLGLIEADTKRGKNESGMSANRWRAIPETQIQKAAT